MGVIWCGEAAVKISKNSNVTTNKIQHGMHRVVYPESKDRPRLTMWFEICTSSQDPSSKFFPPKFPTKNW